MSQKQVYTIMQDLINKSPKQPKAGEIVRGKILEVGKNTVFIDLGNIGTGVLLGREVKFNRNLIKALRVGDEISAMVLEAENEGGVVELSLQAAHREQAWDTLRELREKGEVVKARIAAANRGGLIAEVMGVAGFLPVSQLNHEHYPRVEDGDKNKILQELNKFVNKEMEVRVIDVDSSQQKLIVSEKAIKEEKLKTVLEGFKLGDLIEGMVSGVVDFGAFVRFPYPGEAADESSGAPKEMIEGLIHISEIDWQLIDDPRRLLKVGQKVTAKIIGIEGDRLSLSLKALKQDPWLQMQYQKDQEVEGKVTKINPFGAFVQLDKDIHGLAHVSDFGSFAAMSEVIKAGETYKFKILSIEPASHKMALSLVKQELSSASPEVAKTLEVAEEKKRE